jgi:copper chaperone CopZ
MKIPMIVSALVVAVALALGFVFWGQDRGEPAAFAELRVSDLTCAACVGRVRSAATALPGVGSVQVDLASGYARVGFDPERIGAEQITAAISNAGYPAQLLGVVDYAQLQAQAREEQELALRYVGKIGDRLVTREEFAKHYDRLAAGFTGDFVPPGLDIWAWQELLQRELLLKDAVTHEVVVQDEAVLSEIDRMRQAMSNFDDLVSARYGSVDGFAVKLKDDMIIRQHLDDHVFHGESDARNRQNLVEVRLQELSTRTPIILYDAGLKSRMGGGGGCGGACC